MARKRYIILGAGAAGLSLCQAMLERGVTDEIVVLDRKPTFTDDRTWCFWDTTGHPYSSLASSCWHHWEVIGAEGQRATQSLPHGGYVCLRGIDFYAHIMESIQRHPNVTLKLGCSVGSVTSNAEGVSVSASGETWDADYVFDSRPRSAQPGGLSFSQRFFGQFVRAENPVFDPSRCTLMDFRVSQEHGLHFMYVLPFSPTEALVENTYIQRANTSSITRDQHQSEISAYVSEQYGPESYAVTREEAGAIPMTTQSFSKREGRVFFIGTAGGCSRPSSGYTFTRIQAQCRQIAEAARLGTLEDFQETPISSRFRFFDTVFLQALWDNPAAFPDYFARLFSRVPPETLTAFLSETSVWPSDLHILRSLPLTPFLKAALRAVPLLRTRSGPG